MAVLPAILRREDGLEADEPSTTYTPTMATLVTVLVALMLTGLALTGGLFFLRYRRRRSAALRMQDALNGQQMSSDSDSPVLQKNIGLRAPAKPSHHRRTKSLTTPPDSPMFVVGETDSLMDEKRQEAGEVHGKVTITARRDSVPRIHLTFPEELDEKTGKRESKVVVVTVSEKGAVGLEPFNEREQPPAYREREDMKSLDLERIGGLKEGKN